MSLANMKSAEENLRNAQLGYSEGMLTTNDVITAQTGWLQANSEKIDACIGVRLCEVYLSKVLGTIQY
jgi:outer membrane protein TolC